MNLESVNPPMLHVGTDPCLSNMQSIGDKLTMTKFLFETARTSRSRNICRTRENCFTKAMQLMSALLSSPVYPNSS